MPGPVSSTARLWPAVLLQGPKTTRDERRAGRGDLYRSDSASNSKTCTRRQTKRVGYFPASNCEKSTSNVLQNCPNGPSFVHLPTRARSHHKHRAFRTIPLRHPDLRRTPHRLLLVKQTQGFHIRSTRRAASKILGTVSTFRTISAARRRDRRWLSSRAWRRSQFAW